MRVELDEALSALHLSVTKQNIEIREMEHKLAPYDCNKQGEVIEWLCLDCRRVFFASDNPLEYDCFNMTDKINNEIEQGNKGE